MVGAKMGKVVTSDHRLRINTDVLIYTRNAGEGSIGRRNKTKCLRVRRLFAENRQESTVKYTFNLQSTKTNDC